MKLTVKILGLSCALFLGSCDELLDVNPRQSIDAADALKTPEGIKSNLANIYSYLKTTVMYGRDFLPTAEALADNTRIINRAGGRYQSQGTNALNNHFGNWDFAYGAINELNLLLEALPTANITAALRDETEGQAKGLRALMYFDLMRAYAYEPNMAPANANRGGVPLILKGVLAPSQIELKARASQEEVYAQLYSDLTDAVAKAPVAGGPYYMTQVAANALFARVALYNQDWATAEKYATDALTAKGTLVTNANYVSSWRAATHPESIFEVLFKNASESIGVNESVQSAYTTRVSLTSNTLGGYGAVVPTTAFLNLFAANDVRKNLYELGVARSNSTVIECTKFLGKTGTIYMDNIPVIRVSEVYLIRAEARAKQGNNTGALSDLNAIALRANPGLTPFAGLTGTTLVDKIIEQRRLELAFEGDRWFDLKRRGKDVIKSTGNVTFDDPRILANIPVRELQSNPNLVQNIGY
jgi:hypothetical protein